MSPNKRIFLNIVDTYGRSLFALACGLFSARWVLGSMGSDQWGQTPLKLAVLQRREAVLRRGTHHDEALEDHARQHRALSPRGEPVQSPAPSSFFCSISWTRPMVCRRVICWKSRTRRHDGLGRRHPQATHGRRAARNPAPAAGSRLLWADTM